MRGNGPILSQLAWLDNDPYNTPRMFVVFNDNLDEKNVRIQMLVAPLFIVFSLINYLSLRQKTYLSPIINL